MAPKYKLLLDDNESTEDEDFTTEPISRKEYSFEDSEREETMVVMLKSDRQQFCRENQFAQSMEKLDSPQDKKLHPLTSRFRADIQEDLLRADILALILDDLQSSEIPTRHYTELTGTTPFFLSFVGCCPDTMNLLK